MHTPISPHVRRRSAVALVALVTIAGTAFASTPVLADTLPSDCYSGRSGTIGTVDHPTAAEAIVLRMAVGGGFVPYEVAFIEQDPVFTLYGNDTAIFRPASTQESLADPWPPFQCVRLTPEQVDELLQFALEDGGLAEADNSYPHPFIADAPFTTFTIDADGISKVVTVQALGFEDAPDPEARAEFQALADLLAGFGDEVDGEEPYDVRAYAALLTPWWAEAAAESVAWPWPELNLDDFDGDENARFGSLAPEQTAQIASVPNGGQIIIPVTTPDGQLLSVSIRPVLPGETSVTDA